LANWWVYVARCADDSLYCGIAIDIDERIAAHNAGTGAKYTAGRGPLVVVLKRRCTDKGFALRIEYAIKQLSRREKELLVAERTRLAAIARRLRARARAA
jgi:putative endonuclease